jgi:hypothetical protein
LPIDQIAIAIFPVAFALQFFTFCKVRRALVERHNDLWQEMMRNEWLEQYAVYMFALKRRDKGLDDPKLSTNTRRLLLIYYFSLSAVIVLMAISLRSFAIRLLSGS